MPLLIAGLVLWSLVHLLPSAGQSVRAGIITKIGEGPYKGLFSLAMFGAIALIIFGWKGIEPTPLYDQLDWGPWLNLVLVFIAFNLVTAANRPTNIKRFIRHPQLTSIVIWALAHLSVSTSDRSLVLFGGLGLWALVTIFLINRRDGTWEKPAPVAASREVVGFVVSCVVLVVALFIHQYSSGFMPLPF